VSRPSQNSGNALCASLRVVFTRGGVRTPPTNIQNQILANHFRHLDENYQYI
tara:strand:+ start:1676 stop:1831 length:156 start_codon:yes stop_codon:yes gene_type:complete